MEVGIAEGCCKEVQRRAWGLTGKKPRWIVKEVARGALGITAMEIARTTSLPIAPPPPSPYTLILLSQQLLDSQKEQVRMQEAASTKRVRKERVKQYQDQAKDADKQSKDQAKRAFALLRDSEKADEEKFKVEEMSIKSDFADKKKKVANQLDADVQQARESHARQLDQVRDDLGAAHAKVAETDGSMRAEELEAKRVVWEEKKKELIEKTEAAKLKRDTKEQYRKEAQQGEQMERAEKQAAVVGERREATMKAAEQAKEDGEAKKEADETAAGEATRAKEETAERELHEKEEQDEELAQKRDEAAAVICETRKDTTSLGCSETPYAKKLARQEQKVQLDQERATAKTEKAAADDVKAEAKAKADARRKLKEAEAKEKEAKRMGGGGGGRRR